MIEGKYMVDTEKVCNEIDKDGVPYIEETTYRVFNDGTKEFACSVTYPKPSDEEEETVSEEELQLSRDEIMLDMALSLEEIKLNQEIQMMGGEA